MPGFALQLLPHHQIMSVSHIINTKIPMSHSLLSIPPLQPSQSRLSFKVNSTRQSLITIKNSDRSKSADRILSRSKDSQDHSAFQTYLKIIRAQKTKAQANQNFLNIRSFIIKGSKENDNIQRVSPEQDRASDDHNKNQERLSASEGLQRLSIRKLGECKSSDFMEPTWKLELQIKIKQLQTELIEERASKEILSSQVETLRKIQSNMNEISLQMQLQNNLLIDENRKYAQLVSKLERELFQHQESLHCTRSNLEKLKESIKENKTAELQIEIKKLLKCNENLRLSLKKAQSERTIALKEVKSMGEEMEQMKLKVCLLTRNENESKREEFLLKEIEKLRKDVEISKTEKERFCEEEVKIKNEEIYKVKGINNSLKIQLHFLELTKEKQLKEYKIGKENEIKKLKASYTKQIADLKQKEKQAKVAKITKVEPKRLQRQQSLELELSPDNSVGHK